MCVIISFSQANISFLFCSEKDISEVIQVADTVFVNVSKGEVAKKDLLKKCFDTDKASEVKSVVRFLMKMCFV